MARLGCLRVLSFAVVTSVLGGCSSSSSDPPPDVRPTAVSVVTPAQDVQAAHRLDVQVGIASATALQGVGVAFRAFPQAAYDARDPEIVSYVLGSAAYDVPAGGGTFDAELQIPYDVPEGDYYVVAEADPLNTIAEADETDQSGGKAPLHVLVEHRDHPRLMIEEAVLDVPAFELSWVLGGAPDPLGLTLLVRAEGNAPVPDAEITACVAGPSTGCVALPLGIWDSAAGRHVPQHVVPELLPDEPTSVHLDLHFGPELAAVFDALLAQVSSACLANVQSCAATWGMPLACAAECTSPVAADPLHADLVAFQACLLKCLPFTVEAKIGWPDGVLFEPQDARPARSIAARLQLLAPPPLSPVPRSPISMWPLQDPVLRPASSWLGWIWDPVSLEFVADKSNCVEPVLWSVALEPDQPPGTYSSAGTIIGTDLAAEYVPPLPSDPDARTTKVVVRASACGATASANVTLVGRDPSVTLDPVAVTVEAGSPGAVTFTAAVKDCPVAPDLAWSIDANASARLGDGPGTIEKTGDLTARYVPPRSIAFGPPVPITVRATARAIECAADAVATVEVGLAEALGFEKAYAKEFASSLFGAGVDLYAGAFLDRGGGRADAHARVPVKVFGAAIEVLNVTDHASVDPRPAGEAHLLHRIDTFGQTVNTMSCPGDDVCEGSAEPWSDSRCVPSGPPPVCAGSSYLQPCTRSTDCPADLRCMDRVCTRKCDSGSDCEVGGRTGACLGSLAPGPYKKVFVVVVVPVTIEGKVCADYGIEASVDLLRSGPRTFAARFGPFFELGGYASAAVGYTGLLAVGVRGEIVLVRDDFYGIVSASIDLVPQGAGCPYAAGCIQGSLREGVENVLQGGKGKVFLFADYPTLRWCRWYPCVGTARKTQTLASWGSVFSIESRCTWCLDDDDCPQGVACANGTCADGFPGLLCEEQDAFVSAE